jgi:hypothetical protein
MIFSFFRDRKPGRGTRMTKKVFSLVIICIFSTILLGCEKVKNLTVLTKTIIDGETNNADDEKIILSTMEMAIAEIEAERINIDDAFVEGEWIESTELIKEIVFQGNKWLTKNYGDIPLGDPDTFVRNGNVLTLNTMTWFDGVWSEGTPITAIIEGRKLFLDSGIQYIKPVQTTSKNVNEILGQYLEVAKFAEAEVARGKVSGKMSQKRVNDLYSEARKIELKIYILHSEGLISLSDISNFIEIYSYIHGKAAIINMSVERLLGEQNYEF